MHFLLCYPLRKGDIRAVQIRYFFLQAVGCQRNLWDFSSSFGVGVETGVISGSSSKLKDLTEYFEDDVWKELGELQDFLKTVCITSQRKSD